MFPCTCELSQRHILNHLNDTAQKIRMFWVRKYNTIVQNLFLKPKLISHYENPVRLLRSWWPGSSEEGRSSSAGLRSLCASKSGCSFSSRGDLEDHCWSVFLLPANNMTRWGVWLFLSFIFPVLTSLPSLSVANFSIGNKYVGLWKAVSMYSNQQIELPSISVLFEHYIIIPWPLLARAFWKLHSLHSPEYAWLQKQ